MGAKEILLAAILVGGAGGYAWSFLPSEAQAASGSSARRSASAPSVYYRGCHEVRAAGKAPLFRGQPGYREGMDGDGDGIACEPYVGSGRSYPRRFSRGRRR